MDEDEEYTITLELPDDVYAILEQRAAAANRTVEEEIIAILEIAFPPEADEPEAPLPDALQETLDSLDLLDNPALWEIAQSNRPEAVAAEIETLTQKQQQEALSDEEAKKLTELTQEHERLITLRNQALILLKERGYDISGTNP